MNDVDVTIEATNMRVAAGLFTALDDPSRLLILHHLLHGEHNVNELVDHLGLSQSTVSQHLARLKDNGLVTSRPQGRSSVYSIRHPEELTQLLTSAENILAKNGEIVQLCPTH